MIGLVGIDFKSSPLAVREQFSLNEQQIIEFGNLLKENPDFSGVVIVSTCNRSEFYMQMHDNCETSMYKYVFTKLKDYCGVTENVKEFFYFKSDNEAFKHLFQVVSGAKSMIIGENQVVGQVKQALQISTTNKLADTELSRLFTKSLEVSKRVRTENEINKGAFSVSYAGVEKCLAVFSDFTERNILVVGAGETGTLTLKNLVKKGCKNIVVTNKTESKAIDLANKYEVKPAPLSTLSEKLIQSDIIIVSTASKKALITKEIAEKANNIRSEKKQLFIDLSVPRNVENTVSEIESVIVYDVDDLQEIVDANHAKRVELINNIEHILDTYIDEFDEWLTSRHLSAVISNLKSNFISFNEKELAMFQKKSSQNETEILENYSVHLAEKYSRTLIKNLRKLAKNGNSQDYVNMVNDVFQLN